MLVGAGIDADDPELPEIALLVLAVAVGVFPAALDVLLRGLPQLAPRAECAAGGLHYLLLALESRDVRSDAWHVSIPSLRLKQALDVLDFAVGVNRRALTKIALSLRRLLGEDVALERFHALHFSRARDLEALSRALVRLHLRH